MTALLQVAETQIDSAHEPEHLPGQVHGHTWFVEAARLVDTDKFIPCAMQWHCYIAELTAAFDHRVLKPDEGLAEQLAARIGQLSGAARVGSIFIWTTPVRAPSRLRHQGETHDLRLRLHRCWAHRRPRLPARLARPSQAALTCRFRKALERRRRT